MSYGELKVYCCLNNEWMILRISRAKADRKRYSERMWVGGGKIKKRVNWTLDVTYSIYFAATGSRSNTNYEISSSSFWWRSALASNLAKSRSRRSQGLQSKSS